VNHSWKPEFAVEFDCRSDLETEAEPLPAILAPPTEVDVLSVCAEVPEELAQPGFADAFVANEYVKPVDLSGGGYASSREPPPVGDVGSWQNPEAEAEAEALFCPMVTTGAAAAPGAATSVRTTTAASETGRTRMERSSHTARPPSSGCLPLT
jgi:hypothetical protein